MEDGRPISRPEVSRRSWRLVDQSGRRNHGAVHREAAVGAGVHPRTLSRRAGEMEWGRPHRAVYTLPGTRKTLQRDAAAALLAVGRDALVTGAAALYLYEVLKERPVLVDLVVPATARPSARQGVRLHRTRAYDRIRARTIDGLRIVHPTRALADIAPTRQGIELARLIARAVALRRCTLTEAGKELEVRSRFPGRAEYMRALALLETELTHSEDEHLARQHLRRAGLRPFPRPYPIVVDGILLAEADIAIVELCYDIEVDGPHHDLPEQVQADKARDRRVGRHGGWTVDRFPVELVRRHPDVFVREVLARVRQLQAQQAPP